MNKKLNKIIAILGLVPAIAFANPMFDHPRFGKESHCGHLPPYLHDIDLTDAQEKSINQLIQKNLDARKDKEKTGMEYHQAIQKQVFSKDYSDEKIAGMIKKQVAQHEDNELNRAKLDHAIFELLTTEQKQQVQANLATFSERFKKMR